MRHNIYLIGNKITMISKCHKSSSTSFYCAMLVYSVENVNIEWHWTQHCCFVTLLVSVNVTGLALREHWPPPRPITAPFLNHIQTLWILLFIWICTNMQIQIIFKIFFSSRSINSSLRYHRKLWKTSHNFKECEKKSWMWPLIVINTNNFMGSSMTHTTSLLLM